MYKLKQIILFIFLTIGINNSISAQWSTVYSDSTKTITDIFCLNKDTCWVSGTNGLLVKTTNGGSSWIPIPLDTIKDYGGIYFINSLIGFMAVSDGTGLKTVDGGNTWATIIHNTPPCSNFFVTGDCHALNSDTIVNVAGCYPTDLGIYYSYDSGLNLSSFQIPFSCGLSGNQLVSFYFSNDSIGYAFGNNESIFKTFDRGLTWVQIHEACTGNGDIDISGMSCYNDTICWFGGYTPHNPYALKYSSDGGYTWNPYLTTPYVALRDVAFFSDGSGFLLANNQIYKSSDYGITFNLQYQLYNNPNQQSDFYKFAFLNSQTGYAISTHSVIKTTNGGGPVGINEHQSSALVSVFPNPSNGEFTISKFQLLNGPWHVQIFDNLGKLIFQKQNIQDNELHVNLTDFSEGLYFVKAIVGNKSSAGKVLIVK